MNVLLAAVASFLLGSVPFGVIVGKLAKGIDIRDFGSGNIGASNVLRTLGPVLGGLVLVMDVGKGFGGVEICRLMGVEPGWWTVLGAIMAVFGHTFSVFLKFKGGKGVATSLGVIIGLDPVIGAVAFGAWAVVVAATRYISVASILATISVPLMMIFWHSQTPLPYQILACVAASVIVIKHRSNMARLIKGCETRIGEKVDIACEEGESTYG